MKNSIANTKVARTFIGVLNAAIVCAVLLLTVPIPSWAGDRDPLDVPLRQYAFMLGIALLGGLVSWYAKIQAGTLRYFNLSALIGELATSAFAGLLTFWLCDYLNAPHALTAALVGVAGHMGANAISQIEKWAQAKFSIPPAKVE